MIINDRNHALDGLRGIAATAVIFYHSILHYQILIQTVLPVPILDLLTLESVLLKIALFLLNGNNAVLLFFVLSGFVLRLSLERASGAVYVVVLNFTLMRIFRLYPALFFCMLCYYCLSNLYAMLGQPGMPLPNLEAVLLNASLIDITWHGPSRTIQAEMLAIPFILIAFYVAKQFGSIGMLCCLAFSFFAFETPLLVLNAPNMNSWLSPFMLGMLVAERRLTPFFAETSGKSIFLLVVAFEFMRMFVNMNNVSGALAQTLLCGALVGAVYHADSNLTIIRVLNWRPIQFFGKISYSLYLLNVLCLLVIWSIIDKTKLYSSYPLFVGLGVGSLVFVLTIPLAQFSERVFEQGGIRLCQTLSSRLRLRLAQRIDGRSI